MRKTYKPIDDRLEKIGRLIEEGADINAIDSNDNGNTALHIAVSVIKDDADAEKAVDFLLKHGADKTIVNKDGKTSNDLAKGRSRKRLNQSDGGGAIENPRLDETYEASGVKSALHGTIYQLNLLMLFLRRGLHKGYRFRLATEMNAAEKFDDLVFKYEVNGKNRYRFIQAKHKQDETKKISEMDLLTTKTGAEFNLQKYFISYRKIMQNPLFHGDSFDDFVIATNIDLDDKMKPHFTELIDVDGLLVVDADSKKSKRYKLIADPTDTLRNDIVKNLRGSSDLIKLAKTLSECVANGAPMNLKNELFNRCHGALTSEHIINVGSKTLHANFVMDNGLSADAKKFRTIFEEMVKDMCTDRLQLSKLWNDLRTKNLPMSENFEKVFELNRNPQITNVDDFSEAIFQLIKNDKTKSILLELEKTKKGVMRENINSLAGYVFVSKGSGKNKVLKFSSQFMDPSGAPLPQPLQDFKTKLEIKLKSTRGTGRTIEFADLSDYEFQTKTEYKTYEDGQQTATRVLPNDPITNHEIEGFFKHLTLAVNQPNEIALGKAIESELGNEFNSVDSENVYNYLHVEMLDWMKQKQGVYYTKENAEDFFDSMEKEILGHIWWNVGPLTENFTGRERHLLRLRELMRNQKSLKATSKIAVISGLGGIGKSQLAVKYALENGKNMITTLCGSVPKTITLLRSHSLTWQKVIN